MYRTDPRQLKANDIIAAFEGDPRLKRVRWSDIKGVPVTKLCTLFGLCHARGKYLTPFTPSCAVERCSTAPDTAICWSRTLLTYLADATRAVSSGGLFVNDRKVNDPRYQIVRQEMVEHRVAIVRLGTRNHMILALEE